MRFWGRISTKIKILTSEINGILLGVPYLDTIIFWGEALLSCISDIVDIGLRIAIREEFTTDSGDEDEFVGSSIDSTSKDRNNTGQLCAKEH